MERRLPSRIVASRSSFKVLSMLLIISIGIECFGYKVRIFSDTAQTER